MVFFVLKLRFRHKQFTVLLCFATLICTILKKNSPLYAIFLIGSGMRMMLLFLFFLIKILLNYFLCLIGLTIVFNSLLKQKTIVLLLFLVCWLQNIKTCSQQLSLENPSKFLFFLMLSPVILLLLKRKKNLLFTRMI